MTVKVSVYFKYAKYGPNGNVKHLINNLVSVCVQGIYETWMVLTIVPFTDKEEIVTLLIFNCGTIQVNSSS